MAVQILSFRAAASTSRSGKKMSVCFFMQKENFVKSNNIQAPEVAVCLFVCVYEVFSLDIYSTILCSNICGA